MQGYRPEMEDAHCAFTQATSDGDTPLNVEIFGVFDGHGGLDTSKWISERLPKIIFRNLPSKDLVYSELPILIRSSFIECDSELYTKGLDCGSTAIVAVIIDNHIIVANTGDSRCIISTKDGAAKTLSFDHKPKNLGELVRIHNDGGTVSLNRVNGILALSRAFGDFNFKMLNSNNHYKFNTIQRKIAKQCLTAPEEFQVTVEPEIMIRDLKKSDEFIILACDGVWDCYNNDRIVYFIRHQLALGKKLQEIETLILDSCLEMANPLTGIGFDNMTIILIALRREGQSLENWYEMMQERLLNEKFSGMKSHERSKV